MAFSTPYDTPPDVAQIEAAARRIADHAVRTPLLESPELNARTGGRILIKPETLQRTGSFKFRGAFNKISRLAEAPEKPGAIVAYSSGNHAQGVAAAAALRGFPAVIVMPADAPAIKLANTRAYGAEVVTYDRHGESREAIAEAIVAERGGVLVRPYDDHDVIAGQGTIGDELADQAADRGLTLDALLIPCGGGGLTAGCALALEAKSPATRVYVVEPEGFDDTRRSLETHRRLSNDAGARSFCDALMAPMPGALTFPVNDRLVAGGFAVSDAEVAQAMAFAFRVLKLVVEPGGAVALAAVLAGRLDCRDRTVAVICSGGNVDPETFCRVLAADERS
ncbi:threonine ammonia-lyase [Virgifigura deserti]|uniref:threonine ammonia-lyase n=1 Tax=Virgifigura deserti TaxID=2268457 RepID=UPI003CCBFE2C